MKGIHKEKRKKDFRPAKTRRAHGREGGGERSTRCEPRFLGCQSHERGGGHERRTRAKGEGACLVIHARFAPEARMMGYYPLLKIKKQQQQNKKQKQNK